MIEEYGGRPSIAMIHDRFINYAFQQNSIPTIKEIVFRNDHSPRGGFVLRIRPEPAFAPPLERRIDSVPGGGEHLWTLPDFRLSHDYLMELNERVTGYLHIEAVSEGTTICTLREPIELLARNEWCGLVALPEILAAFIQPNDPAVMRVLDRAAELLRARREGLSLNGYQDRSRNRAHEQVAAIYRALSELGIRYVGAPASFEETGQKVRSPSDIINQLFGNCLDLTLFLAACLEQAGLHPLVIMHEGHAYAGCWLEEKTFPQPVEDDLRQIRKLAEESLIVVMESTLVAQEEPTTLKAAVVAASPHLNTEKPFRIALDVRRSRISRIHPMPTPGAASDGFRVGKEPGGQVTMDDPFDVAEVPEADTTLPPPPQTIGTRIDQWKARLLDLSLRNRLLNFKETKGTIRILTPDPEKVEDELAEERELKLFPKPTVMGDEDPREARLYQEKQKTDALNEHLDAELRMGRLHTHVSESEHLKRLTDIFRSARNSLEENGTNTLYAAVGLLEWKETDHSDRTFCAPILLVPVELKRKSVAQGFSLQRIDEETRLNFTLIEMLRQNFRLLIPGLDPLPEDESGVDVPAVFRIFREAVRELRGWEVRKEVWLGQFSFTKFLLWKDLTDRLGDLTHNRIVNHLVNSPNETLANDGVGIDETTLDQRFRVKDVFCPRSADSTQLAAVMAAADGQDFVLEGPPGTGKSQTIANIISHCLANGKRVLFVAEKRAALDVVHRRLKEDGLQPFCLELHSNKAGKSGVLEQFALSLSTSGQGNLVEWEARSNELEVLRAKLNEYAQTLHKTYPSGLSAYRCIDYLIPRLQMRTVRLSGSPDLLKIGSDELRQMREIARDLENRATPLLPLGGHSLSGILRQDWSPAWGEDTFNLLRRGVDAAAAAAEVANDLFKWVLGETPDITLQQSESFAGLCGCLLAAESVGSAFVERPWREARPLLQRIHALLVEHAETVDGLSGFNLDALVQSDPQSMEREWINAQTKWFLPRSLGHRAIRRKLSALHKGGSQPVADQVPGLLANASRLQRIRMDLSALSLEASTLLGASWRSVETDPQKIESILIWGDSIHQFLASISGDDLGVLARGKRNLSTILAEGLPLLAEGTSTGNRMRVYIDRHRAFADINKQIVNGLRLGKAGYHVSPDGYGAAKACFERFLSGWDSIRDWCRWQTARHAAIQKGLSPILEVLEAEGVVEGGIPDLLERSIRKEFLYGIFEQEKLLTNFSGSEHEDIIGRFRAVDEEISRLSTRIICARLISDAPREDNQQDKPLKKEMGILRKELTKKTRHIPVRKLLAGIPTIFPRLKPCVLMSPLSVAQYLDSSVRHFDVVIFDEASQIPVWDAVGAIARGKQLIVVGDPKQLPPTSFFSANSGGDADWDQ